MPQKKIISDMVATKSVKNMNNNEEKNSPPNEVRRENVTQDKQSKESDTNNTKNEKKGAPQKQGMPAENKPTFSEWRSRRSPIESSPLFEKMKQKKMSKAFGEVRERRSHNTSKYIGISIFVLLALSGGALIAYGKFFHTATIELSIKEETLTLDSVTFTAKNKDVKAQEDDETPGIFYETMSLSVTEMLPVKATGEKKVERKASGSIIIYNDYSTESQKLIKNTRFETPDGKIFRTPESITVPGKTGDTPGSLEIKVFADLPGDEYNIGLGDFTIPGFKGSPQYQKFYARSKTEMKGGFSGIVKTVSEESKKEGVILLGEKLEARLREMALSQAPESSILYDDNMFISYEEVEEAPGSSGNDTVDLKLKGTLNAFLFDRRELSHLIAESKIPLSRSENILVENIKDLSYGLDEGEDTSPENAPAMFSFTLSGSPHIVWEVDIELLQRKLAGEEKDEHRDIFSEFSGIKSAKATISPFWKNVFPAEPNDIKTVVLK